VCLPAWNTWQSCVVPLDGLPLLGWIIIIIIILPSVSIPEGGLKIDELLLLFVCLFIVCLLSFCCHIYHGE